MEYHNNILCIEAGWMIDNGIMSWSNYKQLAHKKHMQIVRRASRNTPALVAYDSIPSRFKAKIIDRIGGDPYRQAKYNILEEFIADSIEASQFFDRYRLCDGRMLPSRTRQEYYANAIVLDAIHRLVVTKVARKKLTGGPVARVWNHIGEAVQGLDRMKYPHALPENPARLKDKYNLYRENGYGSLVHKNFANKHAAKINDEVKESLVVELLADPRNLDNEQVARLYNEIAGQMGWRKISASTVAARRDKYDLEIYAGRQGAVAAHNRKLMQVKRSAPTRPLFYWTLDGWDVELLYQMSDKGAMTYHHRPTVVVVLDPCCKYPVGYAVGTHETPELIKAALRNAALHTAQLFGSIHRAHQIQSDRYAIKAMTPLYGAVAEKVTPARAHNAKAKVIEPYFGYLNKTYCQFMPNWSGFGITANRDSQPNNEFLNKYRHSFPDYEGVRLMVAAIMEKERTSKVAQYVRLWEAMDEGDKIKLPHDSYLYHFGERTGRTNLLQSDGLHVTIRGVKRAYDCFDINFRKHASTRWSVVYDPADTTKILAVNEEETLRFMLEEKHLQPMALRERQEGDAEQLRRISDFNDNAVAYITDFRAATGDTVQELFEHNPQLHGTLARLMLADSKGQHKNRRYVERGQSGRGQAGNGRLRGGPKVIEGKAADVSAEPAAAEGIYDMM